MRKLYVLAMALFAVFAVGAYAASSALAVAEWLWNGATFVGELLTDVEGDLILIHLAGGFLEPEAKILCEGIFDGVVLGGPGADSLGGEDLVTELLSLAGGTISSTTPLLCEALTGCEKLTDVEVYAENLPWLTKLSLMEVTGGGSLYLDLFTEDTETYNGKDEHLPAYHIACLVFSASHEVLCEGETSADITLSGTELLGIFTESELVSEKLEGTCIEGLTEHKEVAVQTGEGPILDTAEGELDVSE